MRMSVFVETARDTYNNGYTFITVMHSELVNVNLDADEDSSSYTRSYTIPRWMMCNVSGPS